MDVSALLPFISRAVGRDLSPDLQLFGRAFVAVGKSLTPEGQVHFTANWRGLADFMETEKGQAALKDFFDAWNPPPASVPAAQQKEQIPVR